MDYLDAQGNYDKSRIIDGIVEIDDKIQEELSKSVINKSRLTRLRYELMLRGLYMFNISR